MKIFTKSTKISQKNTTNCVTKSKTPQKSAKKEEK